MKKLIRILIAACLCCAVGCDSEGSSDEKSSQTPASLCKDGLVLTSSQSQAVGAVVNQVQKINDKDYFLVRKTSLSYINML